MGKTGSVPAFQEFIALGIGGKDRDRIQANGIVQGTVMGAEHHLLRSWQSQPLLPGLPGNFPGSALEAGPPSRAPGTQAESSVYLGTLLCV